VGLDLADEIGPRSYTSGPRATRIAQWFNTSSFTSAQLGTFGNAGRNILIGPKTFNIDFSAHKNVQAWSGRCAQRPAFQKIMAAGG